LSTTTELLVTLTQQFPLNAFIRLKPLKKFQDNIATQTCNNSKTVSSVKYIQPLRHCCGITKPPVSTFEHSYIWRKVWYYDASSSISALCEFCTSCVSIA